MGFVRKPKPTLRDHLPPRLYLGNVGNTSDRQAGHTLAVILGKVESHIGHSAVIYFVPRQHPSLRLQTNKYA
jgi:hypothetical protein